eukprot:2628392-Ditylum_brightwellii.AAC.1
MPLDPNGKIDRKVLLADAPNSILFDESCVSPANELEEKLALRFSAVMGIQKEMISVNTDIFSSYGMNSLKVAQFVSEIRRSSDSYTGELSIRDVYEAPTLRQLSMISNAKSNGTASREDEENKNEVSVVDYKAEATEELRHYPVITTAMKLVVLAIDAALLGTISYYPILLLLRVPLGMEYC